jgi:apolipoprotein N-acyltransferase
MAPWRIGVTLALMLLAWRLLHLIFVVFQHAFLSSYVFLPGAQVSSTYWASIRFAFQATAVVAAAAGLLTVLLVLELQHAARR